MLTQLISTPVGSLHAVWSASGSLRSCAFVESVSVDASLSTADSTPATDSSNHLQLLLADRIDLYFQTGKLTWDLESLDWTAISAFHQRVLRGCYDIPAGETLSYAELAAQAGSPQAARAAGSAMARNRWPLLIPCHRVVGARGQLTGYSGTGGIETKRWLLNFESQHSAATSLAW